jgi:hypothetical protein
MFTVIQGKGGATAADAQEAEKSTSAPSTELSIARFRLLRIETFMVLSF